MQSVISSYLTVKMPKKKESMMKVIKIRMNNVFYSEFNVVESQSYNYGEPAGILAL